VTEPSSSASDIARNVGNGAVSAADVLERHLAAIDAGDAEIHAFNVVTVDVARDQAAAVDAGVAAGRDMGRLAGVPVALKDNMCTQGIPTTCSSKILGGWKPPQSPAYKGAHGMRVEPPPWAPPSLRSG